ncbi:CheR family methyltransferase [Thalassotalea marina]|uniref:Chemotaxis protein R n=1 Tax=Thalassotalea marina TaxID=1673741 RepID=A0A919EM06_9GAMM|nr:protein-glutamate O-methyltransferase CheR [Thalassotalea marina]GHF98431.1 chemotaxis protein R [Thalassotalea marina]
MVIPVKTDNVTVDEQGVDELLSVIKTEFGLDFYDYTRSSIVRRLTRRMQLWHLQDIRDIAPIILNDTNKWQQLLNDLSISVTSLFRDPAVFKSIQQHVFPLLETFPFFKIWIAGCSTGEEVYSLAILLHEHGILKRARIYGTDFNDAVLKQAKEGIFDQSIIEQNIKAYLMAGGQYSLDQYFHLAYGKGKIKPHILNQITFSNHNLTTDGAFGEVELILCRNVLIYFNKTLKQKAFSIFNESLYPRGFLILGTKESIIDKDLSILYEEIDKNSSIYQKVMTTDANAFTK